MEVMYSRKTMSPPSPSSRLLPPPASHAEGAAAQRSSADDWAEESNCQAAVLSRGVAAPADTGLFTEFRRKMAMGEALSRAFARLASALRFSGRITVSFHQGRVTKTVFEELHIAGTKSTATQP
jgi:hypothetical protein